MLEGWVFKIKITKKFMSLSEIKNKLYKKEADADLASHDASQYDPQNAPLILNNQPREEDAWKEKRSGFAKEERKAFKIGFMAFGAIIFIIALTVGFYFYRKSAFSEERMKVVVSGAQEARSGKLLTYEINYENNNRSDLENAKLRIIFPESFVPEENPNFILESPVSGYYDLGTIKGYDKGKITFNGKASTPKGALIYIEANLSFNPKGFSSQFVSKDKLGVTVISTSLELEITAPQNISSGDEVNYLVVYRNVGEEDFSSVKIKVDYPEGFVYSASDPKPFESDNIWYLGQIPSGASGKLVINGKLEGGNDQVRPVKVSIGSTEHGEFISYNEADTTTKIVSSPLVISQIVNGVSNLYANAGEVLSFEINYKNTGSTGMRDVIITENLDSPVLDYSTLKMNGGFFDEEKKTIIWKAPDQKSLINLGAGQSGTFKFSIKVKDILPISSANDKNFVISSVSKIDSPDVPTPVNSNKIISGNKMDIRLNSKLVISSLAYYNDTGIPNSGPIPPKVNEETTYTVHWKIINVSNDISGVRVESALPTGVVFTGKKSPEDASFNYNERNNSISWDVGNVLAGEGVITPAKEILFQIKIKPSADQVGEEIKLLGASKITAKDLFTGQDLSSSAKEKTSNLLEDSSLEGKFKAVN